MAALYLQLALTLAFVVATAIYLLAAFQWWKASRLFLEGTRISLRLTIAKTLREALEMHPSQFALLVEAALPRDYHEILGEAVRIKKASGGEPQG